MIGIDWEVAKNEYEGYGVKVTAIEVEPDNYASSSYKFKKGQVIKIQGNHYLSKDVKYTHDKVMTDDGKVIIYYTDRDWEKNKP